MGSTGPLVIAEQAALADVQRPRRAGSAGRSGQQRPTTPLWLDQLRGRSGSSVPSRSPADLQLRPAATTGTRTYRRALVPARAVRCTRRAATPAARSSVVSCFSKAVGQHRTRPARGVPVQRARRLRRGRAGRTSPVEPRGTRDRRASRGGSLPVPSTAVPRSGRRRSGTRTSTVRDAARVSRRFSQRHRLIQVVDRPGTHGLRRASTHHPSGRRSAPARSARGRARRARCPSGASARSAGRWHAHPDECGEVVVHVRLPSGSSARLATGAPGSPVTYPCPVSAPVWQPII